MKKLTVLLICLAAVVSSLYAPKILKKINTQKSQTPVQYNIADKYEEVQRQLPFVVIIPTYNNEKYCERNIRSALDQEYDNFRIICIDDASTDQTNAVIKNTICSHKNKNKISFKRNQKNEGALSNFYQSIHSCENHEIVVILDGDDWFAHSGVLKSLNQYYANPDVWITYGSYVEYPSYRQGYFSQPLDKKVLEEASIKRKAWTTSHLRTFYAGLFKRVPISNFIHNGHYFPSSADVAMMLPMIEMAREHTYFIPEILYIYNTENPLNDTRKNQTQQEYYDEFVRKKPVNEKLNYHPSDNFILRAEDKADLLVFSYNRPLQLFATLESITKYTKGFENLFILYRADEERYVKGYLEVKKHFPTAKFFQQPNINPHLAFKPMVLDLAFHPRRSKAKYIAFCTDDIIVKDEIDLQDCISALKETASYGFYLRLGSHITYCYMTDSAHNMPNFLHPKKELLAWQFKTSTGDFNYPNSVDFTLYEKKKIAKALKDIDFVHPNKLEEVWASIADHNEIGLCYKESKVVNLPINIVSEYNNINRQMALFSANEMQQKFEEGYKIDIRALHKIKNKSAHMEFHPTFTKRVDENE